MDPETCPNLAISWTRSSSRNPPAVIESRPSTRRRLPFAEAPKRRIREAQNTLPKEIAMLF